MPSSGDLPNPGIKPRSPALQADSSPSKPTTYVKTYWLVKFKYVQFIVCQLYFRKALIKILKENDSCETREKKKQNSFLFFFLPQRGSVQFSHSVIVWLFVTPWTTAHQASLSIINSWSLLKLMSIESVMPSNHLILCRPLLLLPSIFPRIRVFSSESVLHIRWPNY